MKKEYKVIRFSDEVVMADHLDQKTAHELFLFLSEKTRYEYMVVLEERATLRLALESFFALELLSDGKLSGVQELISKLKKNHTVLVNPENKSFDPAVYVVLTDGIMEISNPEQSVYPANAQRVQDAWIRGYVQI